MWRNNTATYGILLYSINILLPLNSPMRKVTHMAYLVLLRSPLTMVHYRRAIVYTVETNTELYNQLVPWGIATRLRSNGIKTAIRHGMGSHREQRNVKEV